MRSDVPIGTALSGGLDSSATVCSMAHIANTVSDERMGRSWQHAFVASFPGTPVDEAHFAKAVTDFLGIPATFIEVDPTPALEVLDRQLYLGGKVPSEPSDATGFHATNVLLALLAASASRRAPWRSVMSI